ncbi:MAG: LysR family transcriptional regulator [Opitutales bacterium]
MTDRNSLLPLRHVGVLLSIAHHGSISAAAAALGTTQPALTKALHRAELELGHRLFERHARGVVPTEAGQAALDYAKLIRRHSQEAVNALDALRSSPGTILVGAGASFLDALLPRAIATVVEQYPSVRVKLRIDTVTTLMEQLRGGALDLLFVSELPGVSSMTDVDWRPLINNEMDVVSRAGHPLAKKEAVTIDDLKDYGWVLGGSTDPQQIYLESVFRAAGEVLPSPTVETLSRAVAIQIVMQSDLLGLMPNIRTYASTTNIVRVNCHQVSWVRVAGIAVRKGFKLPPAGEQLVQVINDLCNAFSLDRQTV